MKVEITSFEDTTPPSGREITLVNRQEGISGNNMGLFIGPLAPNDPDYIGSFAARNVLDDITPATPLDMGIMEPATSRPHGLNFTFYAVYDAEGIPVSYTHLDVYKRQFLFQSVNRVSF